jgi:hypothetical protein
MADWVDDSVSSSTGVAVIRAKRRSGAGGAGSQKPLPVRSGHAALGIARVLLTFALVRLHGAFRVNCFACLICPAVFQSNGLTTDRAGRRDQPLRRTFPFVFVEARLDCLPRWRGDELGVGTKSGR